MRWLLTFIALFPMAASAAIALDTTSEGNENGIAVGDSYQSTITMPTHDDTDIITCLAVVSDANTPLGDTWTLTNMTEETSVEGGDGSAIRLYLFWALGSSVGATETLDSNDTNDWATAWSCGAWSGVDTTPFDAVTVTNTTDSAGTDVTIGTITTNTNGANVIWASAQDDDAGTEAAFPTCTGSEWDASANTASVTLGGWEQVFAAAGQNGASTGWGYGALATAGSSGTSCHDINDTLEAVVQITFALEPAAASGIVPITVNQARRRRQ